MATVDKFDFSSPSNQDDFGYKPRKFNFKKGLQILPHIFTFGNAFLGFCSIISSAKGNLVAAAYFILLAAVMDALDGKIARFAEATSELGMQLDSLCDSISFCLAPAVLVYLWQLKRLEFVGFLVSSLFLMAGILRLARFNLTQEQQSISFIGTPTPIAGCFLATILLNTRTHIFKPYLVGFLLITIFVIASLMISKIPFPSFKHISPKTTKITSLFFIVFIITMGFVRVLLALFIAYFLFAFEEYFRSKIQKRTNKD